MSIEKMMCLSTGHVSQETARQLEAKTGQRELICEPGKAPWVDLLIVYPHGEYGWLIVTNGAMDDHTVRAHVPSEFLPIFDKCEAEGCDWLLLDRDADLIDELPAFDW